MADSSNLHRAVGHVNVLDITFNDGTVQSTAAPGGGGLNQLTGDVTAGPGVGSQAATIAADAVTNAKLANVATATFKGRVTAGTGDPEDLSVAQMQSALSIPGAAITQLTGDVTAGPGSGSQAATITNAVKSFTAVGAAPSANGATISGTAATLQPFDATHPGLVTTGAQTKAGVLTLTSTPLAPGLTSNTAATLTLTGTVATSGTAVAATVNSSNNLNTTNDVLLRLSNAGTTLWDFQAQTLALVPGSAGGNSVGSSSLPLLATYSDAVYAQTISTRFDASNVYVGMPAGAGALTLKGYTADSGSAISIIANAGVALTTTARILSIQNAGTEKAWFDSAGSLHTPSLMGVSNANTRISLAGSNPTIVAGDQANGASAVGVSLRTGVTFSTAGSKIANFVNNATEKAFVSQAGLFGGPVGTGTCGGTGAASTVTINGAFGRITCLAGGLNAGGTITLTNNVITATSIILVTFETTASTCIVVPAAGSCVITVTTAQAASAKISFAVVGAGN